MLSHARQVENLLHSSDEELFGLLPDTVQSALQTKFIETLDGCELEEAVFGLMTGRETVRDKMQHKWEHFLGGLDLLNEYRDEIERSMS